jgi:hypothetical protein
VGKISLDLLVLGFFLALPFVWIAENSGCQGADIS